MVISIANFKGGVSKTSTSIHVAGALGRERPTLLADRDRVKGAHRWHQKGRDWDFTTIDADHETAVDLARQYRRNGLVIVDTPAAPRPEELVAFGARSDLVVVPGTPDALAIDALVATIKTLTTANV